MARKTSENTESVQGKEVETAQPVRQPQTNQPAEEARTQEPRETQGNTLVKLTGRAGRYTVDGVEYRKGQVYEVDAETAEKLLNETDSDGNQPFVQADS